MNVALAFWCLAIICCGFAAVFGGKAGRWIAACYMLNILATKLVSTGAVGWRHFNLPAFLIDAALLAALIGIALRADRWFPVWFAGLHLTAVAVHLGSTLAPAFAMKAYFILQAVWSVPMLLILVIGVSMDQRAGIFDERAGKRRARQPRVAR